MSEKGEGWIKQIKIGLMQGRSLVEGSVTNDCENFWLWFRLEEEESARQKLHLDKVSADAKMKKLEEDLAQIEDNYTKVTMNNFMHRL